ncbi:MAG: hypothetical protein Q8N18_14195 [Opitutaceae bacterium]|nr:hypothetical protein [Opitutaceae bacterium]
MDARDGDARARRRLADADALGRRDLADVFRQRERRDLDRVVAQPCAVREHVVDLPALENLVADAEFHRVRNTILIGYAKQPRLSF